MKKQTGGSKLPILTLLHLSRLKGWKAHLLRRRPDRGPDSGTNFSPNAPSAASGTQEPAPLTLPEREFVLDLARKTLDSAVAQTRLPEVKEVLPRLTRPQACFVTLTAEGALRGCVGHLQPRLPLYQAVIESARNAALHDPRFPPVQTTEVGGLKIEISVLTEPRALSWNSTQELLNQLHPGEHGVTLQIGPRLATFLPRVWTQIPDKVEFLERLAEKAGCSRMAWRENDATVSIYYADCFEEPGAVPVQN